MWVHYKDESVNLKKVFAFFPRGKQVYFDGEAESTIMYFNFPSAEAAKSAYDTIKIHLQKGAAVCEIEA